MSFASDIKTRSTRLILTVISKNWLVFALGTGLLCKKLITAEVWLVLASVVIGVNVLQKAKGISDAKSDGCNLRG